MIERTPLPWFQEHFHPVESVQHMDLNFVLLEDVHTQMLDAALLLLPSNYPCMYQAHTMIHSESSLFFFAHVWVNLCPLLFSEQEKYRLLDQHKCIVVLQCHK